MYYIPVSYTHLDVYKRQHTHRFDTLFLCKIFNTTRWRVTLCSMYPPCTDDAPTGSSTPILSNNGIVRHAIKPPIQPIRIASHELYKKHPAVNKEINQ